MFWSRVPAYSPLSGIVVDQPTGISVTTGDDFSCMNASGPAVCHVHEPCMFHDSRLGHAGKKDVMLKHACLLHRSPCMYHAWCWCIPCTAMGYSMPVPCIVLACSMYVLCMYSMCILCTVHHACICICTVRIRQSVCVMRTP